MNGFESTADGDYILEIKRCLLLGRRAMTSLTAAAAKSCLTLCDPIDGSPPGSPVPGIFQTRILDRLPFPSPMYESEM